MEALTALLETRRLFLRHPLAPANHDSLFARFFTNEAQILDILKTLVRPTQTFTINIPADFLESVPVPVSEQQMTHATTSVHPTTGACPICTDGFLPEQSCTKINHCEHIFHRDCLRQWFQINPQCPMCRFDVRGDQTSLDVE